MQSGFQVFEYMPFYDNNQNIWRMKYLILHNINNIMAFGAISI